MQPSLECNKSIQKEHIKMLKSIVEIAGLTLLDSANIWNAMASQKGPKKKEKKRKERETRIIDVNIGVEFLYSSKEMVSKKVGMKPQIVRTASKNIIRKSLRPTQKELKVK